MKTYNRVYAKIDLDAIAFNLRSIEKKIGPKTQILAVVKTDGYGHGAVWTAREAEGFDSVFGFAVATAEEAFDLRSHGIKKPILILGYTFESDYEELARRQIRPAVYSYEMARQIAKAAQRAKTDVRIHLKIDTGMGRIGYQATPQAADEIAAIAGLPGIVIEGVFTHFARADETDKAYTYDQMRQFDGMLRMLKERGVDPPLKHCANSAAIAEIREANFDLVRAGIILYGLWPSDEVGRDSLTLKPAMEIKSRMVHIKTLEAGRTVSYGGTYRLQEPRRIATIPVGYGDGYPRSLSNRGYVLIHGKKAPILGRICMDQFMVDVTDIPNAKLLDTVTLLGWDEGAYLGMEELGDASGRFHYEFACCIGKRVPRVFYKNGLPCASKEYFYE